jgi:isopentenyl phosphate kinase
MKGLTSLTLVKLGGSLITDKRRPETARPVVLSRLAEEIAGALPALGGRLVVGHGSGSFGHVAASRHRIQEGLASSEQRPGVSQTQARAAALHRRVLETLDAAGAAPFSIAPSSAAVAEGGRLVDFAAEPVALALAAGLLPVVYGDVVMDRRQGVAIASTESVFDALVRRLPEHGLTVSRILWLGETGGIWDAGGRVIPRVTPATAAGVLAAVGGSAGTDVTGGMAHRLEAAADLARRGIASWIGDGRVPGLLGRLLAGEGLSEDVSGEVPGTRVMPDA